MSNFSDNFIYNMGQVSVVGKVKDLHSVWEDLPAEDVLEIRSLTPQSADRLANILTAAGFKPVFGEQKIEEAPKPKAKKAKRPRDPSAPPKLTKKRVADLQLEYIGHRQAGESGEASLSLVSEAHGYPAAKLRKALGVGGEE